MGKRSGWPAWGNPKWQPFQIESSTMSRLNRMSESETTCIECGTPVFTYPPEDGDGDFACGRCNQTGLAGPA